MASVSVRYWAAARAAAGIEGETVEAGTLAELLDVVHAKHPDRRFADVVGICALVISERPVGGQDPAEILLSEGDSVEFLPPFAGG